MKPIEKEFCNFMTKQYGIKFEDCKEAEFVNRKSCDGKSYEKVNQRGINQKEANQIKLNQTQPNQKIPISHPEDALHKQIAQYLSILQNQEKINDFTYNPSGEYRTKITGALLKAKGLKKGLPDYSIRYSNARSIACYLYLEAKAGKNKQTKEQIEYEAGTIPTKNEAYKVVKSIEEVEKAVKEFLRVMEW